MLDAIGLWSGIRCALAFLVVVAAAPSASAQVGPTYLSLDDVVDLLSIPSSADARATMIRSRCVSFDVTDAATTARLRSAGADEAMLQVLRDSCFSGSELVITSNAPADLLIGGALVGRTPWTGRFPAATTSITATVRAGNRTINQPIYLQPFTRTRATFGFVDDSVVVPRIRTRSEVVRELGLEQRWRPTVAEPQVPYGPSVADNPGREIVVVLMGLGGGVLYCRSADRCPPKPKLDSNGWDENGDYRFSVGVVGGIVAAYMVNKMLNAVTNRRLKGQYDRDLRSYQMAHARWVQDMSAARVAWINNHPDAIARLRADSAATRRAMDYNAAVRARNGSVRPGVVIATEPLPRPSGR